MRFGIDFWWLLGGFWAGFGPKLGIKLGRQLAPKSIKIDVEKAGNKHGHRQLLNVKVFGKRGHHELLYVKIGKVFFDLEATCDRRWGSGEYEGNP